MLASSLDYEQTLSTLGQLMVRDFADWCIVDLVEGESRPRRLKVISARASQASLAARLEQLPLDRRLPHLAGPILDTRRPFLVERVTPEKLESFAQSEEHLRILRAIDPRSILGLPLLVRGELLGVLFLISCDVRRARTNRTTFGWPRRSRSARRSPSKTGASTRRHCTPPNFGTRCSASSLMT